MGWATAFIEQLKAGETVEFRPRGHSMSPKIESGQLCTVEPVDVEQLAVGDIVLCKVNVGQAVPDALPDKQINPAIRGASRIA